MTISRRATRAFGLLALLIVAASAEATEVTKGRFEQYCDGIGLFLTKMDGVPKPGELLIFIRSELVGNYLAAGTDWQEAYLLKPECAATAHWECETLATGRVRFDQERLSKRLSGEYDMELAGQRLHGRFEVKWRRYKYRPRICE